MTIVPMHEEVARRNKKKNNADSPILLIQESHCNTLAVPKRRSSAMPCAAIVPPPVGVD